MPREPRKYNFPVWGTQGGGLVREVGGRYFFVEKPDDCMGLNVGDEKPSEWGIAAANDLAMNAVDDAQMREFNQGVDEFFGTLDQMFRAGEISLEQVGSFFPQHRV